VRRAMELRRRSTTSPCREVGRIAALPEFLSAQRGRRKGRKAMSEQKPRYGVDAYLDWVETEGLCVFEDVAVDLFPVEPAVGPRYGVKAAVVHLKGRGDFANMFVFDIPPGGATAPQRHLYEDAVYVLEGTGSTQIEFADGRKKSFEWGPRSLFAIPLNAR